MKSNVDNIELGPAVVTYRFPPGSSLPKKGEVLKDEKCEMVVTDSDEKEGILKVMLVSTETMENRIDQYMGRVFYAIKEAAKTLYEKTSSGMTALVGWDPLPSEEKSKYVDIATEVFKIANSNKLFILQLKEDLLNPE